MSNLHIQTREASLILPKADNQGEDLFIVHAMLRDSLLKAFGGFSQYEISGEWRDSTSGITYDDASFKYVIAARWNEGLRERLFSIAREYCRAAEQETVYVCDDSGEVHFVTKHAERPFITFNRQEANNRNMH
jgi:hypothetical protein